jgi:hypothetical protein
MRCETTPGIVNGGTGRKRDGTAPGTHQVTVGVGNTTYLVFGVERIFDNVGKVRLKCFQSHGEIVVVRALAMQLLSQPKYVFDDFS